MGGVVHGELHAQFIQPHARAGALAIERQRHFRSVRQIECQVIRSLRADAGAGREHALWRLSKRDRNDSLPLGKPLARAQVERYAGPAPVVDEASERNEGFRIRIAGYPLFRSVSRVLSADDIGRLDRQHATKDLVLLLADRVGLQGGRRLHGHEAQNLEQVSHHYVSIGAGLLVETGTLAETQRLRHVDLHVVDEITVPDRLEQSIGETKSQNVLRRFLSQEVIDSEDLFLVEYLVQSGVQRNRARQVGAERFFHDDPRPVDQAGFSQQAYRRQRRVRRHAEVVKPTTLAIEGPLRLDYRRLQGIGAAGHRHVLQAVRKVCPGRFVDLARREFGERSARDLAEIVRAEIVQGCPNDPAAGDEPRTPQIKHAGQQFATSKI